MSLPNSQDNSFGCEPINFPANRKVMQLWFMRLLPQHLSVFHGNPSTTTVHSSWVCEQIFFFSQDRIFLCSLGYPWTRSDSPTSASGVVRLWPCIIILGLMWCWDKIRALCILGKLSINWDTSQSWREHILFQLILLMIIIYEVGIILLLIYQW